MSGPELTFKKNGGVATKMKFINLRRKKPLEVEEENLNSEITSVLERLVKYKINENKSVSDKSEKKKNSFRISSLIKAITILKEHDQKILSGDQAKKLKGIGDSTADRIDLILETGTLPELADEEGVSNEKILNEETQVVESLTTIHGMGDVHALEFYRKYGVKSATDLIHRWQKGEIVVGKHQLTRDMELGLKYYDDFLKRIPRDEIDEFKDQLQDILAEINPDLIFTVVGSYRRKKPTSGDVDVLIAHRDIRTQKELESAPENYLSILIDRLLDESIIIDHLNLNVTSYYKGVMLVRDTPRRIDIMITPLYAYPAAILHGTGSGPFNQRLRAHAMKKGYTLSQKGLFELDEKGKKKSEPIPVKSEKEIFKILGVEYLPPEDRD